MQVFLILAAATSSLSFARNIAAPKHDENKDPVRHLGLEALIQSVNSPHEASSKSSRYNTGSRQPRELDVEDLRKALASTEKYSRPRNEAASRDPSRFSENFLGYYPIRESQLLERPILERPFVERPFYENDGQLRAVIPNSRSPFLSPLPLSLPGARLNQISVPTSNEPTPKDTSTSSLVNLILGETSGDESSVGETSNSEPPLAPPPSTTIAPVDQLNGCGFGYVVYPFCQGCAKGTFPSGIVPPGIVVPSAAPCNCEPTEPPPTKVPPDANTETPTACSSEDGTDSIWLDPTPQPGDWEAFPDEKCSESAVNQRFRKPNSIRKNLSRTEQYSLPQPLQPLQPPQLPGSFPQSNLNWFSPPNGNFSIPVEALSMLQNVSPPGMQSNDFLTWVPVATMWTGYTMPDSHINPSSDPAFNRLTRTALVAPPKSPNFDVLTDEAVSRQWMNVEELYSPNQEGSFSRDHNDQDRSPIRARMSYNSNNNRD